MEPIHGRCGVGCMGIPTRSRRRGACRRSIWRNGEAGTRITGVRGERRFHPEGPRPRCPGTGAIPRVEHPHRRPRCGGASDHYRSNEVANRGNHVPFRRRRSRYWPGGIPRRPRGNATRRRRLGPDPGGRSSLSVDFGRLASATTVAATEAGGVAHPPPASRLRLFRLPFPSAGYRAFAPREQRAASRRFRLSAARRARRPSARRGTCPS